MKHVYPIEALKVLSSTIEVTHDDLNSFSHHMQNLDRLPSFWWRSHPVWISPRQILPARNWPILAASNEMISIGRLSQDDVFDVPRVALRETIDALPFDRLSDAEFRLFVDLSCGLSLEESATQAQLATSTRRKQLQNLFSKLQVKSQSELISFSNQQINTLRADLNKLLEGSGSNWTSYHQHLPKGIRCGVLNQKDGAPIRYLDMGPVGGKPVMVLHPMIFPNLDDADVALCHQMGWRAIWPIRAGCLSVQNDRAEGWEQHCNRTVREIHTLYQAITDQPVPVIALVSSAAYATKFCETYPECVSQLDFVSTCFSAGNRKTTDAYFGDFLLNNLKNNRRLALVFILHLINGIKRPNGIEQTMRRVFGKSTVDQAMIDADFATQSRSERIIFAILNSVRSIRFDYMSQLHFSWRDAQNLSVPKRFWHGAEDCVHHTDDLADLARRVSGQEPVIVSQMGHLTQGAPIRNVFEQIDQTYLK